MVRNLIGLFVIVVLAISGFAWYHTESVKGIKGQPLALLHWEDTTGRATIRQVMQSADFKLTQRQRQSFGYTESIHWFRFHLTTNNVPQELTLDIQNHSINFVDLFVVQDGKLVSVTKTGDWLPFVQRPVPTKSFAFPIYLDAYQFTDYYLRLDKRYEVNLATDITLWRTSDFEDKEQRAYFLWGIFMGVVILVVLLNLIYWGTTSDQVYLWYALYILGLTLRQSADSGLGFQYLWPTMPILNSPDPVIQALWLYLPALIQFQQYFLDLRHENKRLFRVTQVFKYSLWAGSLIVLVMQMLGIWRQYPETVMVFIRIHTIVANIGMVVFVWIIITGLRSDNTLKQLYGAGLALQTAGQIVNIVQNIMRFQVDSSYFIDPYLILIIIFFIDLVVFAYLLAYRYRTSVTENQQLEISLVQTQQETNQKVIEVLESERQQIHKMLLTDVGQRLQRAYDGLLAVPPSPMLTDSATLIQKVHTDLDKITQNILSVEFAEKGLTKSLTELVQQLNQTQQIQFSFQKTGKGTTLSVAQEVQLYRIVTELVNNTIKHSQATQATITLAYDPQTICLTVDDNGKGFDTAKVSEATGGIGVRNLFARARDLDATVTIDSGHGGTKVCVNVPQKIQTS